MNPGHGTAPFDRQIASGREDVFGEGVVDARYELEDAGRRRVDVDAAHQIGVGRACESVENHRQRILADASGDGAVLSVRPLQVEGGIEEFGWIHHHALGGAKLCDERHEGRRQIVGLCECRSGGVQVETALAGAIGIGFPGVHREQREQSGLEASVGVIRWLSLVAVVLVGIEGEVAIGILAQDQSRSESTDEQELFNGR